MKKISHSLPTLGLSEIYAVGKAVFTNDLATGLILKKFEKLLCLKLNRKFCIAISSGTGAIHLALKANSIGANDEVIVSGYSCVDIYTAINLANANVKVAAVDKYGNLDIKSLDKIISDRTKAIIVQHTFGRRVRGLEIIKSQYPNIIIIEDCTHSVFPILENSDVILSLGATKFFTAAEAGIYMTNIKKNYEFADNRINTTSINRLPYILSDIHAAIGICQLKKLGNFIQKRLEIKKEYDEIFDTHVDIVDVGTDFCYRYVIKTSGLEHTNQLIEELLRHGISSGRPVDPPNEITYQCNKIKDIYNSFLSIPIYPKLKKRKVRKIAKIILEFNKKRGYKYDLL
ncbi:DegT/DnrJ/EryC1/StrS aminotransferase family protein [Listeria welshimeri]|nr:DegT/DnrJ/EryC1/StrS aminotransferase family protein [Listeria welshimeri]